LGAGRKLKNVISLEDHHNARSTPRTDEERDIRFRISDPESLWIGDIVKKFEKLNSLPTGWDGYQGRPIPLSTSIFAIELLNAVCHQCSIKPEIFPGSAGDVVIQWECKERLVEAHIRKANHHAIYRRDDLLDFEEDFEGRNNLSELLSYLEWLMSSELGAGIPAAG